MTTTPTITPAILAAHRHWNTYSGSEEEILYPQLHQLVVSSHDETNTIDRVIEQILSAAQSKGYGDEDSFLFSRPEPEEETDYSRASQDSYDEDPDSTYTACVHDSLNAIISAAPDAPAILKIRSLFQSITDARWQGQANRREQENPASADTAQPTN